MLKLIAAVEAREQQRREEIDATLAEMRALCGQGDTIGTKLSHVKAHWCAVWTERHKEKCAFDHVKYTGALKKKLAVFSVDEVCAKISHYVANDEPYYVRARHPFGLFLSTFDTWRGLPADQPSSSTGDRLRELRGDA